MPPLHARHLFDAIMDANESDDPYPLPFFAAHPVDESDDPYALSFFAAHPVVDPASLSLDPVPPKSLLIFEVEVTSSRGSKLYASPNFQHRLQGMAYKQEPDEHHTFASSGLEIWVYRVYEFDTNQGRRGSFLGYHAIVVVPDTAKSTRRMAS